VNRIRTQAGYWVRARIAMLCGALAIGLGVVVASGYQLTVVDGRTWREIAEEQRQRRLHVTPKRGSLFDRNGAALAVSVDVPSVSLDALEALRGVEPQNVPVVARQMANRIAAALSLDPSKVEQKILSKRRFAWLKRQLSLGEAEAIRNMMQDDTGEHPVRGLLIDGEARRYYPRRALASTLLGFVAPDGLGKEGLELSLQDELAGRVEQLKGLRDRSGRLLFADGVEDDRALAGHDVYLTIDQGIQYIAERELALAAETFEAIGGSVVVVAPQTGEILALANWPSYNPNDYRLSDAGQRRNRALTDRFEPGSTMKMFTLAAGLSAGVITPTQQLYCEKGRMPVDNVVIRDTHPAEWLSITQILAVSSNICAAKIGLGLGGTKLYDAFRRFGFGSATELPVPGESDGILLPRSRPWVQVETAAASFGQGISVTNLQLAMGVAALANGGELMMPILVKKVTTATGEVVREAVPKVRLQAVPKAVARTMTELLVAVTEGEGTGVAAAIDGFQVAGKTATAQRIDPTTGRYSPDNFISSFVGIAPARNPALVIAVTLDEPMIDHAGGAVAAPTFRRIADFSLKYLGLVPHGVKPADLAELSRSADPARATQAILRQATGKPPTIQETRAAANGKGLRVPDMTGWPAREVMRKVAELGMVPKITGSGLVARQSPQPGQPVAAGQELLIELEPAS
jgi:cell division protein FtsI (penicillin-binding protein 3)